MVTTWTRRSLFVLAAWIHVCQASAQDSLSIIPEFSYGIIDTIRISGNEKTQPYVILDEMVLRPGMEATPQRMEFDRNRVYRLGLFNRVDIRCETIDGKLAVLVDVSERWYIIPLPVFGFAEGDVKKPFYGAGLLYNNFQGKNQRLYGLVTFGYNPSLTLSFQDPQISREHRLSLSTSLAYSKVRNKSEIESSVTGDFDERHYSITAALGNRINLYENIGLSLGYQIVEIDEYREGRTVSTDGRDAFVLSTLSYSFDTRDLHQYPSKGYFLYLGATKFGFGESAVNFTRFNLDTRLYVPLADIFVLAGRTHGTIVSGGEVPTYARAYFGYGERIRGYYTTVLEGENLAGASAEIRFDLLPPRVIHFTAIPLPPEFSVWRFGITLAVFGDAGMTWFRGEPVTLSDFYSGYGGGINFLLPYDIVIRTEYAWNELKEGQFILGLEASF